MDLKYIGGTHRAVSAIPLPEGWPAADHTEPNEAIAKEKLASGMYARATAAKAAAKAKGEKPAEEKSEADPAKDTAEAPAEATTKEGE